MSVLSAETQTVSVSESTTKGWFNKRHKKDESVTTDHDASVVASRSDVTMATNGGLTIAGSEIRSAGNTDLSAAKAVAISSVAAVEKEDRVGVFGF